MHSPRSSPSTATPTTRVWFAQALRGVACLCVVFYHLGIRYSSTPATINSIAALPVDRAVAHPAWLGFFNHLDEWHFDLGLFGVALFFLISGFVIPFSLRRGGVVAFASRRFLRIYPAYWFALLLLTVVLVLQSHSAGTTLPFTSRAVPFNALLVYPYVGQPTIDYVNWTLVIEDLFYVVAAAISLAGLLRSAPVVAGVATALAVFSVVVGHSPPSAGGETALYWLAYNATGVTFILVGLCWHQLFSGEWPTRTAAAVGLWILAAWAVSVHIGPMQATEGIFLVSNCCAALVFAVAYRVRRRLPFNAVVNWFADISYPLYLVHGLLGYILLDHLVALTNHFYLALVVTLVVVIAAAWVVHRTLEAPFIALGKRIAQRRWPSGTVRAT